MNILDLLIGLGLGIITSPLTNFFSTPICNIISEESKWHGDLYKVRLRIKRNIIRSNVGNASLKMTLLNEDNIEICANWDESPNPFTIYENKAIFNIHLVPYSETIRLIKERYDVPIFVKEDDKLYLFNGFWFGKKEGFYNIRELRNGDIVRLEMFADNLEFLPIEIEIQNGEPIFKDLPQ